jgi:hypothetical protein
MISLIIIFVGTFWEASMDIIGTKHNYERSFWKKFAAYLASKGFAKYGDEFWDNSIAWKNKWKNGDPRLGEAFWGSSRWFVPLMDGWHVVKLLWLMHLFTAMVFYKPITEYFLLDILIIYMVFGAGHELFFSIVHKRPT